MGKLIPLLPQARADIVAVLNYRFSLRRDQSMHQFSTTEVSYSHSLRIMADKQDKWNGGQDSVNQGGFVSTP